MPRYCSATQTISSPEMWNNYEIGSGEKGSLPCHHIPGLTVTSFIHSRGKWGLIYSDWELW